MRIDIDRRQFVFISPFQFFCVVGNGKGFGDLVQGDKIKGNQ